MSERRNVTLGEEIDFLTGFPFESGSYSDGEGDIKLLRGDNIAQGFLRWDDVKKWPASQKSNYKQFELQEGDVVLAMDRPWIEAGLKYASVSMHDLPCLLVQRTARMRGGKNLDTVYLKYIIGSPWFSKYIQKITTGSLVPHISGSQIKDFPLKLQRLGEQKKIVRVLSSIDQKIEINNRINAELEAMAKTLYDYWFVQFDFPFDFAQGTPDVNGKPYKSSGGKMVYSEELKREIPAVWGIVSLNELGSFQNGINYNSEDFGSCHVKIVNVRNISDSSIFINKDHLDDIYFDRKKVAQYYLDEKSILITRSGTPGATRLISEYSNVIYCGFIIHFNIYSKKMKNRLFFYLKEIESSMCNKSAGTILKNVSQSTLKDIMCAVPTDEEILVNFNCKIDSIFDKLKTLQKENQQLSELRDWLLPMLMNGQVQVTETNDTKAAETQY